MIVRPAEAAPPPPQDGPTISRLNMPSELPQRFVEIMGEAVKIKSDAQSYHDGASRLGEQRFSQPLRAVSRASDRAIAPARQRKGVGTRALRVGDTTRDGRPPRRSHSALQGSASTGTRKLDVPPPGLVVGESDRRTARAFLARPRSSQTRSMALRRRLARRRTTRRCGELQRAVAALSDEVAGASIHGGCGVVLVRARSSRPWSLSRRHPCRRMVLTNTTPHPPRSSLHRSIEGPLNARRARSSSLRTKARRSMLEGDG